MPSRLILDKPPNPNDTIYKDSKKWQQDTYDWMQKTINKLEADSRARSTPVGQFTATAFSSATTANGSNSIVNTAPVTVTLPVPVVSTSRPITVTAPFSVTGVSTSNYVQNVYTPVAGGTHTASLAFTAPAAGSVMAVASLNMAGVQASGLLNQVVVTSGTTTLASGSDQTPYPMTNQVAATVGAGSGITIFHYVTAAVGGTYTSNVSQTLAYIFSPSTISGTATATVTATATATGTGTGTFTATSTLSNVADANVLATLVQDIINYGIVANVATRGV